MAIKKITVKPFFAEITVGLQIGYSDNLINKSEIIEYIQEYQNQLILNENIYLSLSLSECDIILSGQIEPHLKLGFINYPKFPLKEQNLKKEIEKFAENIMKKFNQNRVVIQYQDETVMFENSKEIDPRIKK